MFKKLKQILISWSTPHHYYFSKHLKAFSKQIRATSLMIDIGCGLSPYSNYFSCKKLVRVDIEKRGEIDIFCDAQALALKNNCTDLILLAEVLEHIPDERKALAEIHRILNSRGFLIISAPFLYGVHESDDYLRFTEMGLRRLLKSKRFDIIDFQYRGGIFSLMLSLWRDFPREILGGDFQRLIAKIFMPLLAIHFSFCMILTPIAIILDRLDKKKRYTIGYIALCVKQN